MSRKAIAKLADAMFSPAGLITALGAVVALRHYLPGRSLWEDEAALALNIIDRDFLALMAPLDEHQVASPGYLLLVRMVTSAVGSTDEHSLRLVSLVAAIAVGPLVYFATLSLCGRYAALLSGTIAALAPPVTYYAAEVKPYASDIAISAALLLAAVRTYGSESSARTLAGFAALATVSVAFSFPAAITSAGLLVAMGIDALVARDRRRLRWIALAGLPVAIAAAAILQLARPRPETASYMLDFWREGFITFPPGRLWDMRTSVLVVLNAYAATLSEGATVLVLPWGMLTVCIWLFAMLGGTVGRAPALMLTMPWAVAVVMARLALYPLQGRLAVYLLPTVAVGLGSALAAWSRFRVRTPMALMTAIVLCTPVANAAVVIGRSITRQELRTVLADVRQSWRPSDCVYVYGRGARAFEYYRRRYPDWAVADARRPPGVESVEMAAMRARSAADGERLWLVFSNVPGPEGDKDERHVILARLPGAWRHVRTIEAPGVWADLFETPQPRSRGGD